MGENQLNWFCKKMFTCTKLLICKHHISSYQNSIDIFPYHSLPHIHHLLFHVCLSVCLSACLSVCLFVCLSVCLSACLSACLYYFMPVCDTVMYVHLSLCLSVFLSVCLII